MDLNGAASAMATLTLAGLDDDDNTRQIGNRGHGVHAVTEKQYGPELRAGGRRNAPMRGQTWVAPETVVERREWAAPGARVQNDINGNSSQNILSNSLAMQVHDSFTETSHGKSVNHNESSSTKHMTTSRDSLVSHEGIILLYDQKRKRAQNEDNNTEAGEDQGDDCAAWLLDTLAHGETLFKLRVVAVWWCIWRARNETVWNNKPWQLSSVVHEVYRCVGDWQNLMSGAPALGVGWVTDQSNWSYKMGDRSGGLVMQDE
nr:uncharacterized protein LOC109166477 [Ipomoea trifida]